MRPIFLAGLILLPIISGAAAPSRLDTLDIPSTRTGRLEHGDLKTEGGQLMDRWGFIGRVGEAVTIELNSTDFDPLLTLIRPDGSQFENDDRAEGDLNSMISQRMSLDGRFSIIVSSYAAGESGNYVLNVTAGLAPPPPDPNSVRIPAPSIPVTFDHSSLALLGEGDLQLHSGRYADEYVFQGTAGHQVVLDMKSKSVDSHLTLIHPDGEETINDDIEPGKLDSHIELTLPLSGEYRLRASTYEADETGSYEISLMDKTLFLTPGRPVTQSVPSDAAAVTFLLEPVSQAEGSMQVHVRGQGHSGDLDIDVLTRDPNARAANPWMVIASSSSLGAEEDVAFGTHLPPPYLVRVRCLGSASTTFDIQAAPGPPPATLAIPGDVAESLTARQRTRVFDLPADPDHFLLARLEAKESTLQMRLKSRSGRRPGPSSITDEFAIAPAGTEEGVRLIVTHLGGAPAWKEDVQFRLTTCLIEQGEPLRSGTPVTGQLAAGPSAILHSLEQADLVEVTLPNNGEGLALCLVRLDTGEVLARSSRGAEQALAVMAAPPVGVPLAALVASTGSNAGPRHYTLVENHGSSNAPPRLPLDATVPISGEAGLTRSFVASQEALYRVRASAIGPEQLSLGVLHVAGGVSAWTQAESPAPEVAFYAGPRTAQWLRLSDTSGGAATGTLEAQMVDATPLATGDPATAELWGIFVGVGDYEGDRQDLPFCAEDAENLVEVFTEQGFLRRDHAVLLTDADATHATMQAAFKAVALRAGPEDSVIFFFSGHGGQTARRDDIAELDQMNEYICPHDTDVPGRDITDDELARWLDAFSAGKCFVFLDSCNSGGFRDDIATVRGRLGLFASEEDLESFTYEELKSGGILAHVLIQGFKGAADLNGDGRISAGEISDYTLSEMPSFRISDSSHSARITQHPEWSRTMPYDEVLVTLR